MKIQILTKLVIAFISSAILNALSVIFMPTLTNEIALGQMQNDNFNFIAMESWNYVASIINGLTILIWILCPIGIGHDIYKYYKNKIGEEK